MVTRDGLSAKALVFLNFEFQKPTNVGTQAMPLENTEAQERACGIRASESCVRLSVLLGKEVVGSRDPWSSVIR